MIRYRELSRSLRLAVAAPWCLLLGLAGVAASPAFRQLLLDPATGQPTAAVSLSGPHWTGTLDAARLPADPVAGRDIVPASVTADYGIMAGGSLSLADGNFVANDAGVFLNGYQVADTEGCLYALQFLSTPAVFVNGVHFAGGGQLMVELDRLVWIEPNGTEHVLAP